MIRKRLPVDGINCHIPDAPTLDTAFVLNMDSTNAILVSSAGNP